MLMLHINAHGLEWGVKISLSHTNLLPNTVYRSIGGKRKINMELSYELLARLATVIPKIHI